MADEDSDSKTEEATEKKLQDAIERGNVPVSREVSMLASLAAILIALVFVIPSRAAEFVGTLIHFLDDPGGWRLEQGSDVVGLAGILVIGAAQFLLPTVALMMVAGIVASVAQNAPRIVVDRIMPDLSRISIQKGLSRMFGPRGWTEFLKSAAKVGAVIAIVAGVLSGQKYLLTSAMFLDVAELPERVLKVCVNVAAAVTVATLVIAAGDITWARIHWRRDQRMSRQELKEELKQAEGDRLVKARLRSLRMDRARRRMLASVQKATMVVVNPTHYAVAMRYVRSEGGAPIVLAKGIDLVALKIREIAEQHDIPIIEDKPLARALYGAVIVDSAIPPEFYRAVAEIVHLVQERKSSWPLTRNR
ncbi:MAG: flagellar type III secretion system protein FlhB [Hyphomicrobiales bacterium]|nr:flagellar type III secretion system protein FlhB [Hyphomicrobiales bacterium]MBV8662946.1 flagellar type III secretion system protein FlhB [Hyphomicrobiales bacterium]